MTRTVVVDWRPRAGGVAQTITRDIGWQNVPRHILDACPKWSATRNAQDITEDAAIGVLALLIHHLEGAEVLNVLQIGNGGDFLLAIQGVPPLQAESSGILVDPKGYRSTDVLRKKSQQVLKHSSVGFASVVAFSHKASGEVHCYLHYVNRPNRGGKRRLPGPVKKVSRGRKKPVGKKRKRK